MHANTPDQAEDEQLHTQITQLNEENTRLRTEVERLREENHATWEERGDRANHYRLHARDLWERIDRLKGRIAELLLKLASLDRVGIEATVEAVIKEHGDAPDLAARITECVLHSIQRTIATEGASAPPMGTARIEGSGTCRRCGKHLTRFRGVWWSDDDDFMCPDGEEQHAPVRKAPARARQLPAGGEVTESLMEIEDETTLQEGDVILPMDPAQEKETGVWQVRAVTTTATSGVLKVVTDRGPTKVRVGVTLRVRRAADQTACDPTDPQPGQPQERQPGDR